MNQAEETMVETHRQATIDATTQQTRPSVLFRPQLRRTRFDGVPRGTWTWIATYGDLTTQGPNPRAAMLEFDRQWVDESRAPPEPDEPHGDGIRQCRRCCTAIDPCEILKNLSEGLGYPLLPDPTHGPQLPPEFIKVWGQQLLQQRKQYCSTACWGCRAHL